MPALTNPFSDGKTQRAQAQVALGIRLAQSQGMLAPDEEDQHPARFSANDRAIVWTLFMLDRVFTGGKISATVPASAYQLSLPQDGPQLPNAAANTSLVTLRTTLQERLGKSYNILLMSVEVLQIWEQVIATTFQPTTTGSTPFWKDGSALSQNLSSLLEFELSVSLS